MAGYGGSGHSVNKLLDDSGNETDTLVVTYWAEPSMDGIYASLRELVRVGDPEYDRYLSEVEA